MPPRWSTAIGRRQFKASPEGQELTRALVDLLDELTPLHRFDETIPPLIRHLIGEETADLLRVPKSDLADDLGRLARIANWFFVHVLGRVERDLPRYQLMSRMARPFGHDLLDSLFKLERGGERAPFDIPDHLARTGTFWREALGCWAFHLSTAMGKTKKMSSRLLVTVHLN